MFCAVLLSLLAALVLSSSSASSAAEYINGKVFSVPDGDTLYIRTGPTASEKSRLFAIDCPEIAQPHGRVAQGFTHSKTMGKQVTAIVHDVDSYGRSVCEFYVYCESLNRQLRKKGHAWLYSRYAGEHFDAKRLVGKARVDRTGLWESDDVIASWMWRRGIRTPAGGGAEPQIALGGDMPPAFELSDDAVPDEDSEQPQLGNVQRNLNPFVVDPTLVERVFTEEYMGVGNPSQSPMGSMTSEAHTRRVSSEYTSARRL